MRKFKAADFQDITHALEVLDDAATNAMDYLEERSEKWQESDAGGEYQEWLEAIETARDALIEVTETPQG